MKNGAPPEYRPEYISERSEVVNRIIDDYEAGARPVISGWLIDKQETIICEQAVSMLQTDDGPRLAYSVTDTSYVPSLGHIEQVAFSRLETGYADSQVKGNRLLGDDRYLHTALSLRKLYSAKIPVTPVITFVFDGGSKQEKGLGVISAERMFFSRQPQPIGREADLSQATNEELRQIGEMFPKVKEAAHIESRLQHAANKWAREQLARLSVPVFGDPGVFHRPMREWASFKNLQSLSGVLFDGDFPLYTPAQIERIDRIVNGQEPMADTTVLEPVVAISSLLKLVEQPGTTLTEAQRASLYDVLYDLDALDARRLGFAKYAGELAAKNGLIDLNGQSSYEVDVRVLSDELTRLVQASVSREEKAALQSRSLLAQFASQAKQKQELLQNDEQLRRVTDAVWSSISRRGHRRLPGRRR